MKNNKRLICVLSFLALLVLCVICGMIYDAIIPNSNWGTTLFCLGAIVSLFSILVKAQWLSIFTSGGYLIGFIAGIIFQRDYVTPGGDTVNDLWAIWLWTYVGFILTGILVELILLICRCCKACKNRA